MGRLCGALEGIAPQEAIDALKRAAVAESEPAVAPQDLNPLHARVLAGRVQPVANMGGLTGQHERVQTGNHALFEVASVMALLGDDLVPVLGQEEGHPSDQEDSQANEEEKG